MSRNHMFDNIDSDFELHVHRLAGPKSAKLHRYKRWPEREKLFILEALEKMPKGAQKYFLAKVGVSTAHIYYWRRRYILRKKPVIGGKVREPT